ncbi:FecR family protein [Chitinophaga ginsengisoli]|uniref:FecR family protein n=1 Tax=Chitinophaga ginsengisoli TaxID=363837 RepID=A0A2P8G9P5_9BACT|nr:FecR domain-containing protein [Chitinophaga ginsengisoli]PSL30700.1 FecR family protein [Chitinophaga ginsengisoli]
MENKLGYIRSLIMQEIDGQLTEQESVFLLQQVNENPEIAEIRNHLWETVGADEVNQYLLDHTTETQTAKLLSRIEPAKQPRKKVIYLVAGAAAAAAIILLITNIGIFTNSKSHNKEIAKAFSEESVSKNVQLTLSSGAVYNINKDTSVNTAGANWKVAGKTLTLNTAASNIEQFATLTVPAGKDYSLVLPDGSRIQVNAASTVKFPLKFSGQYRDVYVTGECYIKAITDASKPLMVHVPGAVVQVLGTEFNVNAYDSLAKIALVNGKVKVKSSTDSIVLQPGYMGAVSYKGINVNKFDEYETLSWRTGQFIFRNAKFEDVCKVIPRWFGVQVVLDNKQASDKRFSGVIDRYQPLDLQLKGLKATGAIDYTTSADSIIHIHFN